MKHFIKGYNKEIYGRELIGKVKLSQKNIALTLGELEKQGILISKTKGNVKHYFLNKTNTLIEKYIVLTEVQRAVEFLEVNKKIKEFFYKINVKGIICVFGSYAKGIEKKDSDLDLFIIGDFNPDEIKKVGKSLGLEISIKSGTLKDFASSLKKEEPLLNEIIENHVIISGYERFVAEVIKQKW